MIFFKSVYRLYTISFCILFIIVFSSFILNGNSLIWVTDGIRTHYPIAIYFSEYLKNIVNNNVFLLYDFKLELGTDIITVLHTQILGDPLNLILIFANETTMQYFYTFSIVIRYYLIGISFIIYTSLFSKNKFALVIGALLYVFSVYGLHIGYRFPSYLSGFIYFPLILYSIEKIFKTRNPIYLIIFSSLSIFTTIIFSYMNFIIAIIYTIIRGIYLYHNNKIKMLKIFLTIGISFLLGIGVSAIFTLPNIDYMIHSPRANSEYILPYTIFYDIKYYALFIKNYFISKDYDAGYYTITNFSVLLVLPIIIVFLNRKYKLLRNIYLVTTILFLIPIFNYFMQGCSYLTTKHMYIYIFLLSFLLVYTYDDLKDVIFKLKKKIYIILLIYIFFYVISSFYLYGKLEKEIYFFIIELIIIFISLTLFYDKKKSYYFLVCLVIIAGNGYYYMERIDLVNNNRMVYWNQMENEKRLPILDELNINMTNKDFYRIDINHKNFDYVDYSLRENYFGTSAFFQIGSKSYDDLYRESILPRRNMPYQGLDGRTLLEAISSVKYYCNLTTNNIIPYGFNKIKENLYVNENYLPISYTYDKYYKYNNAFNVLDNQYYMLSAIMVEKDFEGIEKEYVKKVTQKINYDKHLKNINIENTNVYDVKGKNNKIELNVRGFKDIKEKGEYYLYIPLLKARNKTASKITIKNRNYKNSSEVLMPEHRFYKGINSYLYNLGDKIDLNSIDIVLSEDTKYQINDIEVLFLPLDNYEEKIAKLKENALQNINIGTNEITGDITVDKKKLLFFSVPYSKGWEAFVDGEKTDIYKANIMYMAIPLEAGNHHIELKYRTPYLDLGIGVSIVSLILSIIWIMYLKRKNKEIKNEEN